MGHAHEVGPFELLRPIGRGGMGVVWLGDRTGFARFEPAARELVRLEGSVLRNCAKALTDAARHAEERGWEPEVATLWALAEHQWSGLGEAALAAEAHARRARPGQR